MSDPTNSTKSKSSIIGFASLVLLAISLSPSSAFNTPLTNPSNNCFGTNIIFTSTSSSDLLLVHRSTPESTRSTAITLSAKPTKKSINSKGGSSGSGFGGGFGSSKPQTEAPSHADPSKTRSVSGYTGSGTKVLAAAANNFDTIRKLFGKDATSDVYVRSPKNDESTFWFVGKVIRVIPMDEEDGVEDAADDANLTGSVYPTENEAVLSQKRLILEYSKNQLRPQNMGGPYSPFLELWIAPGDSEMDVVQNKISLVKVDGSSKDLRDGFHVKDVGYNPEIYVGDEKEKGGLRVVRDGQGKPIKPVFEIN
mmetsp:Transcript_9311/g.19590  ORF Transcript_9311/g.19590 Transcript_9311/m.19590 type:complete len:309 (-) Transcript_9311:162-1088(-)|eukprot:CAMPEP_0171343058 /NCGR_PEP_ID=MMETSP0878-20121228/16176_1 /TAXON_ID=67004 /ORGANISM="Thalassiosira weissflogii, Strain CCMP1336" /LENGTH=308 /DNA_ID=CAMNT_0011845911 /DNA_START=44 /DNA_END=970 /DNA_ORIENTATION=-